MPKPGNLILILFTAAFFVGCGKESANKDYVARVNDTYLTKNELDEIADTSLKNNFYRSEIIRNWIDEELLYQQAVDEGIIDEEEFNRIISNSRKELAGALLLRQVSDQYEFTYTNDDLEKFYRSNNEIFKLQEDVYILNLIEFTGEDEAIDFRNSVLQDEWASVIESPKFNNILRRENNILQDEDNIYPLALRNIVRELYPMEISLIVNTDTSRYTIVQVIDKYAKGTIPAFNLIKDKVEKSFILSEKRKFINEYIKKLYADNDIEVKNREN